MSCDEETGHSRGSVRMVFEDVLSAMQRHRAARARFHATLRAVFRTALLVVLLIGFEAALTGQAGAQQAGAGESARVQDLATHAESHGEASADHCRETTYRGARLIACMFNPTTHAIRLFLNDASGAPLGQFDQLQAMLAASGETLLFAMNAGMYHEDRSPVGLYVENGATLSLANDNDGPGNFHLKPNGIFYVAADGRAYLEETGVYLKIKQPPPQYATQSGPMLVIDGALHHRFIKDSPSRKRRNGVGVTESGTVIFALADTPINFYDFARFFRDELKTPNALYLDGTISRLYAPEIARQDAGAPLGPIVGVAIKSDN